MKSLRVVASLVACSAFTTAANAQCCVYWESGPTYYSSCPTTCYYGPFDGDCCFEDWDQSRCRGCIECSEDGSGCGTCTMPMTGSVDITSEATGPSEAVRLLQLEVIDLRTREVDLRGRVQELERRAGVSPQSNPAPATTPAPQNNPLPPDNRTTQTDAIRDARLRDREARSNLARLFRAR